jgi:hemerythrin superfamily protein
MSSKSTNRDKNPDDAIFMLVADHKKVKALFGEFEDLKASGSKAEKAALVKRICDELTIHASVEEEIFYPAVRAGIDDDDLVDEALVEHSSAKELIAQLRAMSPGDDRYDARVTVLGEQIEHHVKEEEGDMFPKARKAQVDTDTLGLEMSARQAELLEELGLEDPQAGTTTDSRDSNRART